MTAKEYWEELNKMYGTDLEMPENIDGIVDMSDIEFDVAMGMSWDAAMQKDMD